MILLSRRAFPLLCSLILSLEMRVPSIDIYHRIRNPSMDEKVELQYRLRWLSQGSISKVPQSMVDASLELYPIPYSMLKLLCLSEPKKKAGRLGSYAKPEKKNLLSIFELRGYDRLLIRLFFEKYSWLISWVVRLLSTWVVYFIFRPGKPMTLQVRFSFNIDIPMTMDQLRSTKQKANEIFLLGRSIPRNGDPFCRSIPLWLALLGMLLTILGHSWWWTLRQL